MSARIRLVVAMALLSVGAVVPAARAQEPSVTLTLDRQTPFATPRNPMVEVAVDATNVGEERLDDLVLAIELGTAATTRGELAAAMDPANALTTLYAVPRPQEGAIDADERRTFETSFDVVKFRVDPGRSAIYPMSIQLRSGTAVLAELRTPVLFFFQPPQVPMSFAWTFELAPPLTFAPDSGFVDDAIEEAVAPAGRIAAQAGTLRELADSGTPVNVALSPVLVSTLQRMAGGYRIGGRAVPAGEGGAAQAGALLEGLSRSLTAPNAEVFVYPFAAPQLPAMLRSGLARDLDLQIDRGRDLVRSALGVTPSTLTARAPHGQLDAAAVQRLAADGATTLLVDADTVERPAQPLDFAPLPTAALDRPGSGDPLGLVLPDPGVQSLLESELADADPVLAAQQALGLLAAIWQESPVPPEGMTRGAAIALTEDLALPARLYEALGRRIASAPFLDRVLADELVARIPPAHTAELLAPSSASFRPEYVDLIRQERRRVEALRSALPADDALADGLAQDLLYAESGTYVGNETEGRSWIDSVHARTQRVFTRAAPAEDQTFTLASGSTTIPLRIPGSEGPPLAVRIELLSVPAARLRFPSGAVQETTITETDRVLPFRVEATGAGQGSIQVLVRAPNGRVLSDTTIAVRSTAFNRVAVGITAAAALALVALWLRRLLARRRTT